MPWGDGTGPWWAGGGWTCKRGFGARRGFGIGSGTGFGRGSGRGIMQMRPVSKEETIEDLKAYANELGAELEEVKKRIASLESGK